MRNPLLLLIVVYLLVGVKSQEYTLATLDWETDLPQSGTPSPQQFRGLQMHTGILRPRDFIVLSTYLGEASRLAIDYINNGSLPILLDTKLILEAQSNNFSPAKGVRGMIDFAERGFSLVLGSAVSAVAVQTGQVATVYEVAQLSPLASASIMENKRIYPYFNRFGAGGPNYAQMFKDILLYYSDISGKGWTEVGVIIKITEFTTDIATAFVEIAAPEIEIAVYSQFIEGEENLDIEFQEIQRSGARVILGLVFSGWVEFIASADEYGLVGDQYVWLAAPTLVTIPFSGDTEPSRGVLNSFYTTPVGTPQMTEFLNIWHSADPEEYLLAGPGTTPNVLTFRAFDSIVTAAIAVDRFEKKGYLDGRRIAAEDWCSVIRNITFDGVTGPVAFDDGGNVIVTFDFYYYSPEDGWVVAGKWNEAEGLSVTKDVVWHSNSTNVPDLDIRNPLDYWSCHDKEEGRDQTGKRISIRTPGSSDINYIDEDYHCDYFIDCQNMSDETKDCSTSYLILFIVFGVITGLLILIALFLVVFIIFFGLYLKYARARYASPFFLILILLSMIIGFLSVFTWFGKPHPVSCAFQPWLLGLSTVSMIAALSVKNFRIWRIFRFPFRKTTISDLELLVYWVLVVLPALFIITLWAIISTPTASLVERDGKEHYVCSTGGFTGEPGGLIFFFVLVAYNALVLIVGAMISIAVRNAPSAFNECKLLTISIYNLGLLGIVIIPVFLIIQPFNPFFAWILRTCAILYGFSATMFLQFLPIVFGIIFLDKGKNKKVVIRSSNEESPFGTRTSSRMQSFSN